MTIRSEAGLLSLLMVLIILGASGVLAFLERKVSGKPYDERQEIARGKAAQGGFFSMALFLVAMILIQGVVDTGISNELVIWMGIYLGIGVYSTVAIWQDAYVALTHSYEQNLLSLGMLAGFRWMRLTSKLGEYTFGPGDTEGWVDVGAVVLFTWIVGLLFVKWLMKKQQEAEEE